VNKGLIESAKIYGDFFGVGNVEEVEELLTGIRYELESVQSTLAHIDTEHYFGKITKEDILKMMF
ncbi:MAG TPA: lipoate protein ligase C-terminal domain-containing protein, partial [Bacillales bacterium]|nr:lipoate protein ligase C-terminal domain-containing protein [Bacillales bacterium]